jgi:hypothetical protein
MTVEEVSNEKQGRFQVFPVDELFDGDVSNKQSSHTGSIFLTDEELICGASGSRFYKSVSLSDALDNEDTERIPLADIKRLGIIQATGEYGILVDAPSLNGNGISIQFGTRNRNIGKNERDTRSFAKDIQQAAAAHDNRLDIEDVKASSGGIKTMLGGIFFVLVGVFVLLVGSGGNLTSLLAGGGGLLFGLWLTYSGYKRYKRGSD